MRNFVIPIKRIIIILAALSIFDLAFHWLTIPDLSYVWFTLQGDIDFTSIGIINWFIRLAFIYFTYHFQPKWTPLIITLLMISLIPFGYLAYTSLYVFWEYVGLYIYWLELFILLGLIILQVTLHPFQNVQYSWILFSGLLLSSITILVEYHLILGGVWNSHFLYNVIQHVIYDVGMLGIGGWLITTNVGPVLK